MTNHSREHLGRRQLLVMAAVLLGAMLLLVGLLPPQAAQGKQQQEQIPTPPQAAQSTEQQQQQQEELVLDKDPQGHEYVAGELLVTYEKGASKKAKEEAPKKVGAKVEKGFPEIGVQHVSVPEAKNEKAKEARQEALKLKKKALEQDPDVKAVDYNYVREGAYVPNDPDYGKQWGYPKINAPAAWDTTRGSSNVKVAVLDSGIDYNHADLKGKVVGQINFVTNPDTTVATDDHGHGTHVAGTVAASTNNGTGVAGTCPNCSLLIAKVLDQNNRGYDSDLIAGINWASSNGAKVINMSLGGYPSSSALETAINNAWAKGAVLAAAAGQSGTEGTKHYPAAYENVIAVAATDSNDARATFDNPNTPVLEQSNSGDWVDVAAPGKDIYSTFPSSWAFDPATGSWKPTAQYRYFGGTSMATPHVSGLAGLIFSRFGGASNKDVVYGIVRTAVDLGTPRRDPIFGAGRINAHAAVNLEVRDHRT
jgi:thermitase